MLEQTPLIATINLKLTIRSDARNNMVTPY